MKRIRLSVAEIWPFEIFQNGGQPPSWIDLVQPEVGPFDPPSPKTLPRIKREVAWMPHSRDLAILNFPRWRLVQPEIAPFDPPTSKTLP